MKVKAIAISDIHLCHTPPVARSAEPDWYEAMRRPLREVAKLSNQYKAPVIIAGDIFDKWNSNPQLINFALEMFSEFGEFGCFTIPGQHDLPDHNYGEMHRSAYGTLKAAGVIVDLPPDSVEQREVWYNGFPWGMMNAVLEKWPRGDIAVCHHYCWDRDHVHGGEEVGDADHARKLQGQFQGYKVVIFGDNHKGFKRDRLHKHGPKAMSKEFYCALINCGSLMRRRIDEIKYKPRAWLIYDKYRVKPYLLDISQDLFLDLDDDEKVEIKSLQIEDFVDGLKMMGSSDDSVSYRDAVRRVLSRRKVRPRVVKMILKAIGD